MKRQPVLHPFCFAAYSILAVYAHNANEVPIGQLFRSLVLILVFAALAFFGVYRITRDWQRAGLVTTLALFWAVYFGHLYSFVTLFPFIRRITGYHLITLGTWTALILILSSKPAWKRLRNPNLITTFLNITAGIVLVIPVVTTALVLAQTSRLAKIIQAHPTIDYAVLTSENDRESLPDIYYIVVDAYGREDTLEEYYQFDNEEFLDYLTQNGFYVAAQSKSNYMQTELSLASSLNMEYLDYLTTSAGDSQNRGPLIELIHHSSLRQILEAAGYQFVAVASGTLFTQIRDADLYLSYTSSHINEFEALLLSKSVAAPLIETLDLDFPLPSYDTHRRYILYSLDMLPSLPALPGPKFVFIHILAPHPPFVFDQNGNPVQPSRPYFIGDATDFFGTSEEYTSGYTEELIFLNRGLEKAISALLKNSKQPPIVIIQSDHGPGRMTNFFSLEETCLKERFSILNAYLFPDRDYQLLNASTTPVNTFRIVLKQYLGADLLLIDEKSFYSTWKLPYQFTDVTSRVNQICSTP